MPSNGCAYYDVPPTHQGNQHAESGPCLILVHHDVNAGMQGWLVLLQGEGIVAALIDDLLGDGALAVECAGGDNCSL